MPKQHPNLWSRSKGRSQSNLFVPESPKDLWIRIGAKQLGEPNSKQPTRKETNSESYRNDSM
jgi:hypothetical protein